MKLSTTTMNGSVNSSRSHSRAKTHIEPRIPYLASAFAVSRPKYSVVSNSSLEKTKANTELSLIYYSGVGKKEL